MQPEETAKRRDDEAVLMDSSPDGQDRVADFFARHGGASAPPHRCASNEADVRGWSEVYAADGYTLRCEWSQIGDRKEMTFSEIPSRAAVTTEKG